MTTEVKVLSHEAHRILFFMMNRLSTLKYGYKETVLGCYEAAIQNYGYKEPEEGKDFIIAYTIEQMNQVDKLQEDIDKLGDFDAYSER